MGISALSYAYPFKGSLDDALKTGKKEVDQKFDGFVQREENDEETWGELGKEWSQAARMDNLWDE